MNFSILTVISYDREYFNINFDLSHFLNRSQKPHWIVVENKSKEKHGKLFNPVNIQNRLLSEYQVNKEVEEQNIQRQIDRWGKPLYLLTKKEMDIIFENSIRNNGNTFALNQIKGN